MKFFITYKPVSLCSKRIWAVCYCGREMTLRNDVASESALYYICDNNSKCGGMWTVPKIGNVSGKLPNSPNAGSSAIGYDGHPHGFSKCLTINGCAPSHLYVSNEIYDSIEVGQKIVV